MANFTLQDFFNAIGTRVVDTSQGTVTQAAMLEFANSGLRRIRRNFDPPQSEVVTQMAIYNGVQMYTLPAGFKEYIGVYDNYFLNDTLNFKKVDEFDFWRTYQGTGNLASESRDTLNRYLLLALGNTAGLTNAMVHNCDTYNGNGTWTANTSTSDCANVATDTLYVREGAGSVKFDIDVSQSVNDYAELSNSDMTAIDLSGASLLNIGTMFCWVYLPNAVNYTSFTLRWGSSASDYYESTVTGNFQGGSFRQGWNLLGFDWSTATTTGSPTASAVNYLLFRATFPNTFTDQTGLRIDFIIARQKKLVNLHYMTDYMVVDSTTAALKEKFTSVTDLDSYFNCDASFVDWLTYVACEDVFTYYKIDPGQAAHNKALRLELESDIAMRFPSRREIPTRSYIETDSLADAQN